MRTDVKVTDPGDEHGRAPPCSGLVGTARCIRSWQATTAGTDTGVRSPRGATAQVRLVRPSVSRSEGHCRCQEPAAATATVDSTRRGRHHSRSISDPGAGTECDTIPAASAVTACHRAGLRADDRCGDGLTSMAREVRVSRHFTVTFVDDAKGRERRTVTAGRGPDSRNRYRGHLRRAGTVPELPGEVLQGHVPPATVQDTVQLGHEEVRERFRLACQTHVIADCTIMAMPPKVEAGHQLLAAGHDCAARGAAIDSGVAKHVIRARHRSRSTTRARTSRRFSANSATGLNRKFPSQSFARFRPRFESGAAL